MLLQQNVRSYVSARRQAQPGKRASRGMRKHIRLFHISVNRFADGDRSRRVIAFLARCGLAGVLEQTMKTERLPLVNMDKLPMARDRYNLCPHRGCGHLKVAPLVSVRTTNEQIASARQCSHCQRYYRDHVEVVVYVRLPQARQADNRCPNSSCEYPRSIPETIVTQDAGEKVLRRCPECQLPFKPFTNGPITIYVWTDLPMAKNILNDCPACGEFTQPEAQLQTDRGVMTGRRCSDCKTVFRPYQRSTAAYYERF